MYHQSVSFSPSDVICHSIISYEVLLQRTIQYICWVQESKDSCQHFLSLSAIDLLLTLWNNIEIMPLPHIL